MLNCSRGSISVQYLNILHSWPLDLANRLDMRKMRRLCKWTKSAGNLSLFLIGWYYESHCAKLGEFLPCRWLELELDSWRS